MSKTAQWRDPRGRIRSSTTRTRLLVPSGASDHVNGGEISVPSQVYCDGISPPGGIAGLANNRGMALSSNLPGHHSTDRQESFHAGDNLKTKTGPLSPRPLPSPLQHGNDF